MIAQDDSAIKLGCCDSTHRKRYQASYWLFTRRAVDVISEACFSAMTGDRHDELTAMNLSMIAVALTPSSKYEFLKFIPVWLNFSSFLLCSVFFSKHETIYTT